MNVRKWTPREIISSRPTQEDRLTSQPSANTYTATMVLGNSYVSLAMGILYCSGNDIILA